jgi:DNA polymerase-3 subunit delta
MLNKSTLDTEEILKLTNLADNYSASELVDNSLAKNKKKTINILNENNFSDEDCIIILRVCLSKLKRLLKLQEGLKSNKNSDTVISSFRPPIFWKDKEIIKKQINNQNHMTVKNLINKTNETELLIKKYPQSSINIMTNFILEMVI